MSLALWYIALSPKLRALHNMLSSTTHAILRIQTIVTTIQSRKCTVIVGQSRTVCALLKTVGLEPYNVLLFHVLLQLTQVTLKHRVEVLFYVERYTQLLCMPLYYIFLCPLKVVQRVSGEEGTEDGEKHHNDDGGQLEEERVAILFNTSACDFAFIVHMPTSTHWRSVKIDVLPRSSL